jgi:colicin import membrane protein
MSADAAPSAPGGRAEAYLPPRVHDGPVLPVARPHPGINGWGLAASVAVHAVVLTAALLIQLPSPSEGPLAVEIPVEIVIDASAAAMSAPAEEPRRAAAQMPDLPLPPEPRSPEFGAAADADAPAVGEVEVPLPPEADAAQIPPPEQTEAAAEPPPAMPDRGETAAAQLPAPPQLADIPPPPAAPLPLAPAPPTPTVGKPRTVARGPAAQREAMMGRRAEQAAERRRAEQAAARQKADEARRRFAAARQPDARREAPSPRAAEARGTERQARSAQSGSVNASAPPNAPAADSGAYRGQVIAHLTRFKRYPRGAQLQGSQGTPTVAFAVDAAGRVSSAALARSSGDAELDGEALAMVRRAVPFPPPPPGAPRIFSASIAFKQ